MNRIANRSRRLAAKLRETLLGIKSRESQIDAILANEELSAEAKDALVGKIRKSIALDAQRANQLSTRKQQLAYEDTRPVPATTKTGTHFISHTDVLTDDRQNPTRWTRLSRKEGKCAQSFFLVQEAYGAR